MLEPIALASEKISSNCAAWKGERIAEPPVFTTPEEIRAYQVDSGRGSIALVEKWFVNTVLRYGKSAAPISILDVASGPGWIPMRIAQRRPGWKITAIDAMPEMLAHAKEKAQARNLSINWFHAHADALALPRESFDIVFSHFAFHEFPKPLAALKEMARVLKPGGTLIIQDLKRPGPLMSRLSEVWGLFYSKPMRQMYTHCLKASYKEKEMADLMKRAGLDAQVTSQFGAIIRAVGKKGVDPIRP